MFELLYLGALIAWLFLWGYFSPKETVTKKGLLLDPESFWHESHREFERRQKRGDRKWHEKR